MKPDDRKKKASPLASGGVVKPISVAFPKASYTVPLNGSWSVGTMIQRDLYDAYNQLMQGVLFTTTDKRDAEFASLGFAAGVVRGVRSFSVDELGRLTGIHYEQVWMPTENQAECRRADQYNTGRQIEDYGKHLPGCECGFYAYYDGSNDYRAGETTITAVIEGYGSTVIGSRGFRCAKARIVALHIPDSVKRSGVVARNYPSIPQFDSFLHMIQEFPPIGDGKTPGPEADDFWTRPAS